MSNYFIENLDTGILSLLRNYKRSNENSILHFYIASLLSSDNDVKSAEIRKRKLADIIMATKSDEEIIKNVSDKDLFFLQVMCLKGIAAINNDIRSTNNDI